MLTGTFRAACAGWLPLVLLISLGCSKSQGTAPAPSAQASAQTGPIADAPPMPDFVTTVAGRVGSLAPNTGIAVGEAVPDVAARDLDGKLVQLKSLYQSGSILLVFYRGGWCPYCNLQIHELVVSFPEYQRRGVTPVAISVDRPEQGAKLQALYRIPFPVLSDSNAAVLAAFHMINQVDDAELASLKAAGIDLDRYSGKKHHQVAIPGEFLIDHTGKVRFAHSDTDFKTRPSSAEVLASIDDLNL